LSKSTRLGARSSCRNDIPVAFPPGRAKLETISAPVHSQVIHFAQAALQVHDARENARLVENGFEGCGNRAKIHLHLSAHQVGKRGRAAAISNGRALILIQ
jgi:hypothetical protein